MSNQRAPRITGTIKFFDKKKGYGFIKCDGDGGKEVFFHATDLGDEKHISDGQEVTFILAESQRGPRANLVQKVRAID